MFQNSRGDRDYVLLLWQLGGKTKHFKFPGNPKPIVQEITKLYTYFEKILRE